jgi:hypothetical protein
MRKSHIARLAILAGAVTFALVLIFAPQTTDANNAAFVIPGNNSEYLCGVGADAAGFDIPFLLTDEVQVVATSSGNTKLTCQFDVPEAYRPSSAVVNTGWNCGTYLGLTTNSRSVASPSGNLTLSCFINGSN